MKKIILLNAFICATLLVAAAPSGLAYVTGTGQLPSSNEPPAAEEPCESEPYDPLGITDLPCPDFIVFGDDDYDTTT